MEIVRLKDLEEVGVLERLLLLEQIAAKAELKFYEEIMTKYIDELIANLELSFEPIKN